MSGTHEPDPQDRVPVSGDPCAAGRAATTEASFPKNAGGSRTHYKPLCRRPPHRLAPALDAFQEFPKCPRQDSNLVLDLRRVACDPPHSEDVAHLSCEYPAEDSNLVWQLRILPCVHHTRRAIPKISEEKTEAPDGSRRRLAWLLARPAFCVNAKPTRRAASVSWRVLRPDPKCLDLDSNQDQDLRRVRCDPLHHRDVSYEARARGVEPREAVLEAAGSPGSTLV
jgi:hypothetical protein